MKSIAIITDAFPPDKGAGKNRIIALSKQFLNDNYKVHLITVPITSKPNIDEYKELLKNKNFYIKRTGFFIGWEKNSFFNTVKLRIKILLLKTILFDRAYEWYISARIMALRYIKANNINIIMSSSPSFSSALIAKYIKHKYPSIKWIMDMRDPWLENKTVYYNKFQKSILNSIEKNTINTADKISVVTNTMKEHYEQKYNKNIYLIRNGFEYYKGSIKKTDKRIIFAYTGILYKQRIKLIREFINTLSKSNIDYEFHYAGMISKTLNIEFKNKLKHRFVNYGYVNRKKAISILSNADILILPIGVDYAVPSKFYDYISYKKPILVLMNVDNYEISNIIEKSNIGIILKTYNNTKLESVIEQLKQLKPDSEYIDNFNYNNIYKQFKKLIEDKIV